MKKALLAVALAAVSFAAPAAAWEGKTTACFDKQYKEARFTVRHVLIKPQKQQYEHRNGRIELVVYPPVYREIRTQTFPAHYVMVPIDCK